MTTNLFKQKTRATSTDQNTLQQRLATIKQRLLVMLGAVLMFLLAGFIQLDFMETDPAPQIWLLLMLTPVITSIYLLVSSTWRTLPLIERRNTIFWGMVVGLLAFSFLPMWLIQHQSSEALPFTMLTLLGGLLLNWAYKKVGQLPNNDSKGDDLDLFP